MTVDIKLCPFVAPGRSNYRGEINWVTVDFTPMAGWVNVYVYETDEGRERFYSIPSPGVLSQKWVSTSWWWDNDEHPDDASGNGGCVVPLEDSPEVVRLVFAGNSDGYITPALCNDLYWSSMTEAEWQEFSQRT